MDASAIQAFVDGLRELEIDDRTLLSERLEPRNSCREVLGRLILHARDELAERARLRA